MAKKKETLSGGECPACGANGRGDNGKGSDWRALDRGLIHHPGRKEPVECSRCGETGYYEDFGLYPR